MLKEKDEPTERSFDAQIDMTKYVSKEFKQENKFTRYDLVSAVYVRAEKEIQTDS